VWVCAPARVTPPYGIGSWLGSQHSTQKLLLRTDFRSSNWSREFEEITTDIGGHISPAAIEAAQLAQWTSRLAYADSGCTLPDGPTQSALRAVELAPTLADRAGVVAAVRYASESVAGLAVANQQHARAGLRARRVLVATRSLPEKYDAPAPFTVALEAHAAFLLMYCRDTARAAGEAADAAGEIAARTRAPSRTWLLPDRWSEKVLSRGPGTFPRGSPVRLAPLVVLRTA
jgi:hypothetical protein